MNAVEKAKKKGEWNLVIYKSRATRWEYFMENPQGGGHGSSSYPSLKGAIAAGTRIRDWGGKTKYHLIIAKWDPKIEDFKVTKTEWRSVPKGKKADTELRNKLIRLAHDNPDLRPKILPLLKSAMTRGETYPDVRALVHDRGITLSVEVGITGQGMEVSTAKDRLDYSLQQIRKVMNGGLMKAAQDAVGKRIGLGKFAVLQGAHPWLVKVITLLHMDRLTSEEVGVVAEAIAPFIKRQYLEYKK